MTRRFAIGDRVTLARPYACGGHLQATEFHPDIGAAGEVVGLWKSDSDPNLPLQYLVNWLHRSPAGNELYVDDTCLDPFAPPPNLRDRTAVEQWLDA